MLLNGHGRGAATGRASCSAEEQVQKRGYIVIVETDDLIRELLERWLGEAGYGVIAAAEFRDSIQASRKFSIALLEYFDRTGFTIRVGDQRKRQQVRSARRRRLS